MDHPELTRGGYSIFHETMADMTWLEVERAARNGAVVLWGLGVIEEHVSDSRRAIVRQEGARVRVDDPRFTELARPVIDSEQGARTRALWAGLR